MTNFPPSACGLWGKFVTVPASTAHSPIQHIDFSQSFQQLHSDIFIFPPPRFSPPCTPPFRASPKRYRIEKRGGKPFLGGKQGLSLMLPALRVKMSECNCCFRSCDSHSAIGSLAVYARHDKISPFGLRPLGAFCHGGLPSKTRYWVFCYRHDIQTFS
jgi:hypothetical protein